MKKIIATIAVVFSVIVATTACVLHCQKQKRL